MNQKLKQADSEMRNHKIISKFRKKPPVPELKTPSVSELRKPSVSAVKKPSESEPKEESKKVRQMTI